MLDVRLQLTPRRQLLTGVAYRERTPDLPELVYNRFFIHQQRFTIADCRELNAAGCTAPAD